MSLIARSDSQEGRLAYRLHRPTDRRNISRSTTRALDVLEFFGEVRRPLRAVEIARQLDMSSSSANQLLKTMVDSAHLVFDAKDKTYLPSSRLATFGTWTAQVYGDTGSLRALATQVYAETGMLVTLSTPHDLSMQVVEVVGDEGDLTPRGLRCPLFSTAIGSAFLASRDDAEVDRLAERARIPAVELPGIHAVLSRIRTVGLADGPSLDRRLWSLALLLPLHRICVPTVLGLAGLASDVEGNMAELAIIMQRAAATHFDH